MPTVLEIRLLCWLEAHLLLEYNNQDEVKEE